MRVALISYVRPNELIELSPICLGGSALIGLQLDIIH